MTTSELEDVIKQLSDVTATKSPSEQEALPQVLTALHDLNSTTNPQDFITKAYNILANNHGASDVGTAVARITLARNDGAILGAEIGRQMMSTRIAQENTKAVGTFLRAGESINGFSREYIGQTSPDMDRVLGERAEALKETYGQEVSAFTQKTKPIIEEIDDLNKQMGKIKDTEIPRIKNSDLPQLEKDRQIGMLQLEVTELGKLREKRENDLTQFDQERDDIMTRLGRDMVSELAHPPLSDVSKSYLRGLRDAITGDPTFKQKFKAERNVDDQQAEIALQKIATDMVNNNTSLRYVSPRIGLDPEMKDHQIWVDTAQLAITSFNSYQKDSIKASNKISAEVGTAVHTQDLRGEVQDMHEDIVQSPEPLRFGNDQLERDRQQKLQGSLKAFDDRIHQLETDRNRLQRNPTTKDKIKAFFQHGLKGVQGEIDKLNFKLEVTRIARTDVELGVDPGRRQEAIDRLKHNAAALTYEIEMTKGVVIQKRLAESLNTGTSVTDKQVQDAIAHHDKLAPVKKDLEKTIKTQEKAMSVREKLGGAVQQPPQQGQGKGIRV